jgi:uncharacterized protein YaiI (UPF0178 family)
MPTIYVDADGCPVKDEVYRVAKRSGFEAVVVANTWLYTPDDPPVKMVVVKGHPDAADDWIAEHVGEDDVVVTADIPLAARCLERRSIVVGPKGKRFTEEEIGNALAMRELYAHLREICQNTGGPAPFTAQSLNVARVMHAAVRRCAETLRSCSPAS